MSYPAPDLRGGFLAVCACIVAAPSARAQGPDGPAPEAPEAEEEESAPPPGRDVWAGWGNEEGFVLRSADGENAVRFGALIRAEARWNGADRKPQSEYDLQQLRLDLSGRFEDIFRFRLQPDITEGEVELQEAWIGVDLFHRSTRFMAGNMRVPFGLEEMRPQEFIDFPRLSIAHQFTPGPDAGLFLFGHTPRGLFEWNLAVANGSNGDDTSGDKDLATRLVVFPFRDDARTSTPSGATRTFENLQFGGALTVGTEDQDISGTTIDNAVGLPLMIYSDGVSLDGRRLRIGLEGAWYLGPWFVQGELMRITQAMSLADSEVSPDFNVGYLDVSYALTGEERGFTGVKPAHPVDEGGAGAWIAALRFSELHTDGQLSSLGYFEPDTWVGRVRSLELGISWVLTEHATLRGAFVRSMYTNDVLVGGELVDAENSGILQFQLSF